MMSAEVQRLEELLSRVQRNRIRLEQAGATRRGKHSEAVASVVATEEASRHEEEFDDSQDVIDLVNPTSVVPPRVAAVDESDFSSVAPVSEAPAAVGPSVETESVEVDGFSDQRETIEDPTAAMAASEISEDDDVSETDFGSVAPASIIPEPEIITSTGSAVGAPVEVPLEVDIQVDDTGLVAGGEEAEELELVDTESQELGLTDAAPLEVASSSAQPVSTPIADPFVEVVSRPTNPTASDAENATQQQASNDGIADSAALSRQSFDVSSTVSSPIVTITGATSQKSWAIGAVLQRAWQLGNNE